MFTHAHRESTRTVPELTAPGTPAGLLFELPEPPSEPLKATVQFREPALNISLIAQRGFKGLLQLLAFFVCGVELIANKGQFRSKTSLVLERLLHSGFS